MHRIYEAKNHTKQMITTYKEETDEKLDTEKPLSKHKNRTMSKKAIKTQFIIWGSNHGIQPKEKKRQKKYTETRYSLYENHFLISMKLPLFIEDTLFTNRPNIMIGEETLVVLRIMYIV